MCIVCSVASLLLYLVIEIERLVGFWLLAASTFSADLTGSRLFDHLTWRAALLSFRFFSILYLYALLPSMEFIMSYLSMVIIFELVSVFTSKNL